MRKLGLRNQLRAVTVLLAISVLFLTEGCVLKSKRPVIEAKSFYPEYYAARQLSNEDIVKLRELTVSSDLYIADSAELLLGSYYLYYGDKNYGKVLIERSYQSKNLDDEMRLFGKLWKMETLVVDDKKDEAVKLGNEIKEMKKNDTYMRVMQIYCNQLGVAAENDEKVNECIDTAISGKEKFVDMAVFVNSENILPVNTDNMTYEEYLEAIGMGTDMSEYSEMLNENAVDISQIKPDSKINIVGGDIFDDLATGIFYGLNKYGNSYQLEPVSEYAVDEENKESMILKTDSFDLFIGGMKSNIGVSLLGLSDIALEYNMLNKKDIVVFIASDSYYSSAKMMASKLKEEKKKAYVINMGGNFQIELQNILTDKGDLRYTIVIMSNEKDFVKTVPIAQFWKLGRGHDILVITDFVGNMELTDEERRYLKGIYILTGGNLTENVNYKKVASEFETFNGMPMSGRHALGYDIVGYINSILNKDKVVEYITNIKEIKNGYAVRNPVLLYVGEKNITKKEEYDMEQRMKEAEAKMQEAADNATTAPEGNVE